MSIIITILAITLPIALVIFLISAIIRSVRKDKNEESFQNIIRTMYVYLVMIILLIIVVTSIVVLFDSGLDILLPEVVSTTYDASAATRALNSDIATFTSNIAMLCISIPMFVYYSSLARKEHKK
jgi:glucose uptake protein GlcU